MDFLGPNQGMGLLTPPKAGPSLVDSDSTSGIYVPSSQAQWVALGLTPPDHIWLCQDSSGNLANAVVPGKPLVKSGAPDTVVYNYALSGWTRTGVKLANLGAVQFTASGLTMPSFSTGGGVVSLMYWARVSNSNDYTNHWTQRGPRSGVNVTMAGRSASQTIQLSNGGAATILGTLTTSVAPIVLRSVRGPNGANGSQAWMSNLTSHVSNTHNSSAVQDATGYVSLPPTSRSAAVCYIATWYSASAAMSNTDIKTMLQTLGWNPTWTP